MIAEFFFLLFVVMAAAGGVMMVASRNPVASLMFLVLTLFALSGLFVLLDAHFLAAVQVIVYAGAIMVLFLFVIMLLNLGVEPLKKYTHTVWGIIAGSLVFILTFLFIIPQGQTAKMVGTITNEVVLREGHTELIGKAIFVDFLLPFELASILLLVAIVGAVILAKREV